MPRKSQSSQARQEFKCEYHLDSVVVEAFERVLNDYQKFFSPDQPMPQHRADEIAQIQEYLCRPNIKHVKFHQLASKIVENMWTGWVVRTFQVFPWSSRLKLELEKLLCHTYDISNMQERDNLQMEIQKQQFVQWRETARNHNNNNAEQNCQTPKTDNADLQTRVDNLQADVERQNGRISSLETQLATNSQVIENQKKQIKDYEQELTDANSTIDTLSKTNRLLEFGKNELKKENAELKIENAELKAKLGGSGKPDPGSSSGAQQENPRGSASP